jgi:hypothetical protein
MAGEAETTQTESKADDYPRQLYKDGGDLAYEGHSLGTIIVEDAAAEKAARKSGYGSLEETLDALAKPAKSN